MKSVRFSFAFIVTLALVYALNTNWTGVQLPALGKLLDPFHGFWQNSERGDITNAELSFEGLKGEVSVIYDSMMIPHIYATNDDDLYFAQGYITASHRLWQMETSIRAGEGRLAEVLGEALLDRDRTQRRIGMTYAAANALIGLEKDPATLAMVTQYTAGINAYINTLTNETLPFEYKLLNFEPEPWTNLKSAMLLKNMAQTLNMGEKDIEMTNMLKLYDKATIDLLFPDIDNPNDPIVDRTNNWKFTPIKIDTFPMAVPSELTTIPANTKPSKDVGSNNWAVHGSKTLTGAPLLSNDPHLSLSLPSIWYIIHLNSPNVNTMGASLPGGPAVISGFNDSIAWGETNAQRDLVDFYRIQFKDSSMNEYLSDGKWRASRKVVEKFEVKGGSTFIDTVVYTHHGPVTYDANFHGDYEKKNYAFRWVSHDEANEMLTFYKLNRGKNFDDYTEALNHFQSPGQNFVFASTGGDIAMRVQGKFPVRRQDEGKFVLDGTRTYSEVQAYIPNEQNVMDKNPARGFVSSANQYPADVTYPYYINASSYEVYRNRRINQVLAGLDSATPRDMMNLQQDNFNLKAAESLPYFLSLLDSANLNDAEKIAWTTLKKWDYISSKEALAASYYDAWWRQIRNMAWDELEVENVSLDWPTSFNTIKLLKEKPDLSFFDIKATPEKETARELVQAAFKKGVETVEAWKTKNGTEPTWAVYKDMVIRHLMGLDPLSVHVLHGGGTDIVNASSKSHGPSWRMVVSLEKSGIQAWGVYPGGQSGNPGSKWYSNMVPMWGDGKYIKLAFENQEKLKPKALATITLKPAAK